MGVHTAVPSEHLGELKKLLAAIARSGDSEDGSPLGRAIELIAKNFGVKGHEVAVLGLTADERYLRFLVPGPLRVVGQIPLSSNNSLAARTVREKRPEIINHFSVVRHASVFEGVPISDEMRGDPIQKIMSTPISLNNHIIGVLQVSRKAKTVADAGPDFTHPQLRELKSVADALAPCLPALNRE
jgi:GAF domain